MQNMFDYLQWRGDLSFERDAFNEIDNLILSCLTYLEFDDIVPCAVGQEGIKLHTAAEKFRGMKHISPMLSDSPFFNFIPDLLERAAQTTRFQNVSLSCFVNQIDHAHTTQFSALVFSLNSRVHFIAFRGTDDTFAGWIEDFQMSFLDEVPAQTMAVNFVNEIVDHLKGDVYIGGHSKGGNLAIFSAAHATPKVQKRIRGIYNNDGPGFQAKIIRSDGYQRIRDRIFSFLPKSAVVGLLLERGEDYKIVSCSKSGLLQHSSVHWGVCGTHFIYEKELTKKSKNLSSALKIWLNDLSMEERRQFVDSLSEILQATGVHSFSELNHEKIKKIDMIMKTIKEMDPKTKSFLRETLLVLIKERARAAKMSFGIDRNTKLSGIEINQ